jgi:hypothetical protein
MNDKTTLNILNGQAMYDYFKQHDLNKNGVYVPFNEAMCVGEVTTDIFSKEFNKYRCDAHSITMDQYNEVTLQPLQILFENQFSHIVLWFDDDMFCQINLLTILAYLNQTNYRKKITFNLVSHDFKVLECYELNAQGYTEMYKQVMVNRCIRQSVDLSIMSNGINLYFEYLKEENEITAFLRKHEYLEIDTLVTKLLKTFVQYGLGDTQYIELINRCRN